MSSHLSFIQSLPLPHTTPHSRHPAHLPRGSKPPVPYQARRRAVTMPYCCATTTATPPPAPQYVVETWDFNSFPCEYAHSRSTTSPSGCVIFVHGFGANCQHFRQNLASLSSAGYHAYALDLLGFGMGAKPAPGTPDSAAQPVAYRFEYWTKQLLSFIETVVKPSEPVYLVANSIGAMVTLQLCVENADLVAGQVLISPSLRMLNVRKRSWLQDIAAPLLMNILSYRPLGAFFLKSLAQPKQLRNVLQSAYSVHERLDEELIEILGRPARTDGALDVFLSFIMYDDGPIPEDFLPLVTQPTMIIWGRQDQFEPYELGQALKHYAAVERFVTLEGVGHCAHDERPDEVNGLVVGFLKEISHKQARAVGS